MSINEQLISAVTPVVSVCVPDTYSGDEVEYCTFNYNESPELFGDNMPQAILFDVQLHWFIPVGINPLKRKQALCRAVLNSTGSFPSVINASDDEYQHYVFEFQMMSGVDI